ncbi:MAG: Bug family tripartite tricarboxylate transporter substrate binding protein [Burkholderiales bacterium]
MIGSTKVFVRLALLAFLAANCGVASAQNWPSRPIRFILPFAPGGVADITARIMAAKMSENIGQQVVIENRPGAGMIVSAQAALATEPDGHMMVIAGNGTAISTSLFKSLPFDVLRDFTQLSTLAFFDLVMVAGPDSRFKSAGEVVAFAKANPGKLNIGSISIGSTQNLTAELFKSMAGIDAQIVPFKASPDMLLAMRSTNLDVGFEILPAVISQIRANSVRLLGVAGNKRFDGMPNVPTIGESGVSGFLSSSWNGISTKAGTPGPIVDRMSREINVALAAPDVIQKMREVGAEARGSTPDETRKLMVAEIAKWKVVIERAKIPLQ